MATNQSQYEEMCEVYERYNKGDLVPVPNCVDYNQKVRVIAKEMADSIWEAINNKVQVVRCKDCKHRIPNPHGYTCKKIFKEVSLDDYCAWGERRDDEQTI